MESERKVSERWMGDEWIKRKESYGKGDEGKWRMNGRRMEKCNKEEWIKRREGYGKGDEGEWKVNGRRMEKCNEEE